MLDTVADAAEVEHRKPPSARGRAHGTDLDVADLDWDAGLRRELLDRAIAPEALLYRLFHESGVRVYREKPVSDACRCSRERVVGMLRGLPRDDLTELKVDGRFVVTCEFCNRQYPIAEVELADPAAT